MEQAPANGRAPAVTILSGNTTDGSGSPDVYFGLSRDGGPFAWTVMQTTNGTWSFRSAGLLSGSYQLRVAVYDAAGNRTALTHAFTITTDPTALGALQSAVAARPGWASVGFVVLLVDWCCSGRERRR